MASRRRTSTKLRHPWLDANDPANARRLYRHGLPGYWVPTPEEIEAACDELKAMEREQLKLAVGFYVPREERTRIRKAYTITVGPKQLEESRLCDCPYWGTEFTD
jgi:hypothetical protein